MDFLPKNKIPMELSKGLFRPEYVNRDVDLTDFIAEEVINVEKIKARTRVRNRVLTGNPVPNTNRIPVPLTEAEAEETDRLIYSALERIVAARSKIEYTRQTIDEAISLAEGGKDLSFKVDLKGKPRIKRALRKLFGEKKDKITYTMYKEMVKAKMLLEKKEAQDYGAGKLNGKSKGKDKG